MTLSKDMRDAAVSTPNMTVTIESSRLLEWQQSAEALESHVERLKDSASAVARIDQRRVERIDELRTQLAVAARVGSEDVKPWRECEQILVDIRALCLNHSAQVNADTVLAILDRGECA